MQSEYDFKGAYELPLEGLMDLRHSRAVRAALRIVDRMQRGDVSEYMEALGLLEAISDDSDTVEGEYIAAFKAMAAQMIKECVDE